MSTTKAQFDHLLSTRATYPLGGGAWGQGKIIYSFAGGKPDPGSFPYDDIVEATRAMMAKEGADALTYGDAMGYLGLREVLAEKHAHLENLQLDPANILLTNGSLHALSLVISAFVNDGDPVVCEAPTFSGTLGVLRRHGADLHGVPLDELGIDPTILRQTLAKLRDAGRPCKLIYTMPTFQNPAGPTASLERRREILAIANEFDTLILEDDAYGDLRFEGEFIPSLYALDDQERVVRAGTLSKILGAGVRLGWLVAPKSLLPVFMAFNFGGGVSPFTSRVAAYYMRDHMQQHIPRLIDVYRNKRDAMLQGLDEGLHGTDAQISKPAGGFFIWIKLPTGTDMEKMWSAAQAAGIGIVSGKAFMPNGGGEDYIRLAYSYDTEEQCHAGAAHLANIIRGSIR